MIVNNITVFGADGVRDAIRYYELFGWSVYRVFSYGVWMRNQNGQIVEIIKRR